MGQTENLKNSLREHNTGYGSQETRPTHLHPWGVFAFVCGFDDENINLGKERRKNFLERLMINLNSTSGPETIYTSMRNLVEHTNTSSVNSLVIVKCGQVPVRIPETVQE